MAYNTCFQLYKWLDDFGDTAIPVITNALRSVTTSSMASITPKQHEDNVNHVVALSRKLNQELFHRLMFTSFITLSLLARTKHLKRISEYFSNKSDDELFQFSTDMLRATIT